MEAQAVVRKESTNWKTNSNVEHNLSGSFLEAYLDPMRGPPFSSSHTYVLSPESRQRTDSRFGTIQPEVFSPKHKNTGVARRKILQHFKVWNCGQGKMFDEKTRTEKSRETAPLNNLLFLDLKCVDREF